MKRVLLTVHKFFPQHRAGTEVLTLKVAQELKRRRYKVLVVSANPPDVDARHAVGQDTSQYEWEGIPVHVVEEPLRLRNYTFRHEFLHEQIGRHFSQLLLNFAPDLVHIFHAENLSASIIDAATSLNLPIVSSLTDFWFVCPVVQLKRPNGDLCQGPSPMAANCLTCYTPALFPPKNQIEEAIARKLPRVDRLLAGMPGGIKRIFVDGMAVAYCSSKLPSAIAATMERPGQLRQRANRMDAIMVPTQLMWRVFENNGIDPRLMHHVPFGIDTKPLTPYQTKSKSDHLRIGFIGTLFEHKGVDVLINAFHLLPEGIKARLLIYGDVNQFKEYAAGLVELAKQGKNKDLIEFRGTFPNARLGEVLAELDALVIPSRWYENTPLVIQSALATKTPIIATDLGGLSELVKHGENGLLFPVNDVEALKERLLSIYNDPNLLAQFRDNIKPERTVSEMVDDIETVYEKVLKRKAERAGVLAGA